MKNNYDFVLKLARLDYFKYLDNSQLLKPIQYILSNEGKNLRPYLLLSACDYFQINLLEVKQLALALEMIHTYSLVHDDLPCMDNDDYRRGKLTLHKVYDEGIATLVGDALLSDAFTFLTYAAISDSAKINLVRLLGQAIGSYGMVEGQKIDIHNRFSSEESIIEMFIKKTGMLFSFALCAPAVIKKSGNFAELMELGKLLGVCFQLHDDIGEYEESKEKSPLIHKVGIRRCKELYSEYQHLVDMSIERLNLDKSSDLYEIISMIRG